MNHEKLETILDKLRDNLIMANKSIAAWGGYPEWDRAGLDLVYCHDDDAMYVMYESANQAGLELAGIVATDFNRRLVEAGYQVEESVDNENGDGPFYWGFNVYESEVQA